MVAAAAPTADGGNPPFRIRGTLTITRAASIQREIDAEADPLVIDLSGVEKMDTVGAWLVYRTVRDRGAKVVNASPEAQSLLEQVAEFDTPVKVHPEEEASFFRVVAEIGEWISETGRTLVGLLGFFGATLVGLANLAARPKKFRWNATPRTLAPASPEPISMPTGGLIRPRPKRSLKMNRLPTMVLEVRNRAPMCAVKLASNSQPSTHCFELVVADPSKNRP